MNLTQRTKRLGLYILLSILALGQATAWAAGEAVEYRFEHMLPNTQRWDIDNPNSIAIAADGSVWLTDNGIDPTINPSIKHTHPDGSLINQIILPLRSNVYPYSSELVDDIALAPDGSVWITRYAHIFHYSDSGRLIKQFGKATLDAYYETQNIAIARDGSVWVSDLYHNNLRHLSAEGDLIAQVNNSNCQLHVVQGECAVPPGSLYNPNGLATATDGSVWLTNMGDHRIHHYAADGRLIKQFGGFGQAPGTFNLPMDVAVAADGSIWVADTLNERLQHFSADGTFMAQIKTDNYSYKNHLTIAPDGSLWLVGDQRIQHINAEGQLIENFGRGTQPEQFSAPKSLAVAPDNSVWVADSGNAQVQHFTADGRFLAAMTLKEALKEALGGFGTLSVSLAKDGSLWLVTLQGLRHYQTDGHLIAQFDNTLDNDSYRTYPQGIAFADDGSSWVIYIYWGSVVTKSYSILYHFSVDGRVLEHVSLDEGYYTMIALAPIPSASIAIATDGSLWVNNLIGQRVHLDAHGKVLSTFNDSAAVTPAADGSIWTVDSKNQRIQHLAADGRLLSQFGGYGADPGQFKNPQSIAVSADGSVWVADTGNHRIQKFVPKASPNSPADYDDKNGLLYLDDVAVDGTHYQATLYLQDNAFRLLTLLPALASYTPTARFDAATNLVSIPLARAFGQDYQAQFKYLGDSLFELTTATPK